MRKNRQFDIRTTIKTHILNNRREYIIITLIFIIGIFLGVLFANNIKESQTQQITTYLNNFIDKLKNIESLNNVELLKISIFQNIIIACILWFFGTTVIGIPIVFGLVLYRGFCLGFTISSCIMTLGLSKGLIFVLIALLLQNIIFIPAIIAISVSGFKLYKSIIKDVRKENIKLEIVRHTIFSIIMLLFLILSSTVEILISTNFLKSILKYF